MKFWRKDDETAAWGLPGGRIKARAVRIAGCLCAVVLLGVALSAQTESTGDPMHKRLRAIGQKLQCQCEPCGKTVGDCDMGGCRYRDQVNSEIRPMLEAGMGEAAILAKLRDKFGTLILASPPAQGFSLLSWIMPFAALAAGLIVIRMVLKRWMRPEPAATVAAGSQTGAGAPSSLLLEKYRDEIEKELEEAE